MLKNDPELRKRTPYGFRCGNVFIELAATSEDGYVHLQVITPRKNMDITVTPTGKINAAVKPCSKSYWKYLEARDASAEF